MINGIDVSALMDTIDAVKKNAEIAKFRLRGRNAWMGGDHNRSTIKGFYGACQEHRTESAPSQSSTASRRSSWVRTRAPTRWSTSSTP